MRSYARTLGLLTLCVSSLAACSSNGDYQLAVSWLINGSTPDTNMCQEHGIARARIEVSRTGGDRVKTVEGPCDGTIRLSDGYEYGGFYTNPSFTWDVRYDYTITLVDANGNAVSAPQQASFYLGFDEADIYELNYLDYVDPIGTAATLSGDWSFASGSSATVATDCTANGVQKVRILATSDLDEFFDDVQTVAEADCAAGRFQSQGPLLASGAYRFVYQAIRTDGSVAATSRDQQLLVQFGNNIVLERAVFFGN